jgi:hypothetical protein
MVKQGELGHDNNSSTLTKSSLGRPDQEDCTTTNTQQHKQFRRRMDEKQIEMQPLTSNMSYTEDSDFPHQRSDKLLNPIEIDVDDEFVQEYDDDDTLKKPWNLEDWLYPPHLPRSCQLLRMENIAIPACYLLVGILQGLSGPLINVYPIDLGATEAQQTTLSTIKSLPASFKLLFGFLSDNVPINGYRRKSYMIIGWGLAAFSMFSLLFLSDVTLDPETNIPPENSPSIMFLSFSFLSFGTGTRSQQGVIVVI